MADPLFLVLVIHITALVSFFFTKTRRAKAGKEIKTVAASSLVYRLQDKRVYSPKHAYSVDKSLVSRSKELDNQLRFANRFVNSRNNADVVNYGCTLHTRRNKERALPDALTGY